MYIVNMHVYNITILGHSLKCSSDKNASLAIAMGEYPFVSPKKGSTLLQLEFTVPKFG